MPFKKEYLTLKLAIAALQCLAMSGERTRYKTKRPSEKFPKVDLYLF
jgi:hypothetical protein